MIERGLVTERDDAEHRPVAELLRDTAIQAEKVVRGEVQLAIAHLRDEVVEGSRRVALVAIAAIVGACALLLAMAAVVALLATRLPLWAALAVVAASNAAIVLLVGLMWSRRSTTAE